jgi:hypothetical protein
MARPRPVPPPALLNRAADHRLAHANMLFLDCRDQHVVHPVARTQLELLAWLVEHIDRASLGARKLDRLGDDRGQYGLQVDG